MSVVAWCRVTWLLEGLFCGQAGMRSYPAVLGDDVEVRCRRKGCLLLIFTASAKGTSAAAIEVLLV